MDTDMPDPTPETDSRGDADIRARVCGILYDLAADHPASSDALNVIVDYTTTQTLQLIEFTPDRDRLLSLKQWPWRSDSSPAPARAYITDATRADLPHHTITLAVLARRCQAEGRAEADLHAQVRQAAVDAAWMFDHFDTLRQALTDRRMWPWQPLPPAPPISPAPAG
jgi:hypothetical protein